MKPSRLILGVISLSCLLLVRLEAAAQNSSDSTGSSSMESPAATEADGDQKPLSLESTETTTTETSHTFWEQAPLTGPIVTDRPGFSDSAALVPCGHLQIESGYSFTYDREGDRRVIDHTMPEIALRAGLTDWLELRLHWAGYSYSEVLDVIKTPAGRHVGHEDHVDGGTDLNLGFKIPILRQYNDKFNLSIIPSLNVPTGSDSKSANNVVPTIKFPWNYAVTQELTIYGSILGRVNDGSNGQFFQTAATLAAGYKITDQLTWYLEYFGAYPANRSEDASHLLSTGPIIQLTENVSLDLRVSAGLNEQAPDFQTSIGFGIRF